MILSFSVVVLFLFLWWFDFFLIFAVNRNIRNNGRKERKEKKRAKHVPKKV